MSSTQFSESCIPFDQSLTTLVGLDDIPTFYQGPERRGKPEHHDLIHYLESTLTGNEDLVTEYTRRLEEAGILEKGAFYSMCSVDGDLFPYGKIGGTPILNTKDLAGSISPGGPFQRYNISHGYCRRHADEAIEEMKRQLWEYKK